MNYKKTKKLSNGFFMMLGFLSLVIALGTGCGGGGGGGGAEGTPSDPGDPPPEEPTDPLPGEDPS